MAMVLNLILTTVLNLIMTTVLNLIMTTVLNLIIVCSKKCTESVVKVYQKV